MGFRRGFRCGRSSLEDDINRAENTVAGIRQFTTTVLNMRTRVSRDRDTEGEQKIQHVGAADKEIPGQGNRTAPR